MKNIFSVLFFTTTVKHWVEGAPLLKHSVSEAIFFPSSSNDICKNLLIQEPGHHLLADPDNCNKFFSCQYVSETGWLAYSLSCPQGTHFDGVYCVEGEKCRGNKDVRFQYQKSISATTTLPATSTASAISTKPNIVETTKVDSNEKLTLVFSEGNISTEDIQTPHEMKSFTQEKENADSTIIYSVDEDVSIKDTSLQDFQSTKEMTTMSPSTILTTTEEIRRQTTISTSISESYQTTSEILTNEDDKNVETKVPFTTSKIIISTEAIGITSTTSSPENHVTTMPSATTKSVLTTAKVETTEAITEENVTITSTENETNDAEDQTTTEIMAEILKYPTTTETMLMTEDTGITSTLSPDLYPSNTEVIPTTNTVDYTDETTTTMSSTTTEAVLTTEVTEITSTLSPESSQTTTELIREILTTMSPSEVIPTTNTVESTEGNTEDFGIQSTFTNTVIVEETTEIEAEMTSNFDNTSTTEETNSTTETDDESLEEKNDDTTSVSTTNEDEEMTEDIKVLPTTEVSHLMNKEGISSTEIGTEELFQFDESPEATETNTNVVFAEEEIVPVIEIWTENVQIEESTEMPTLMNVMEMGTTVELESGQSGVLIDEELARYLPPVTETLLNAEDYYTDLEQNRELKTIIREETLDRDRQKQNSANPVSLQYHGFMHYDIDGEQLSIEGSGRDILTEMN